MSRLNDEYNQLASEIKDADAIRLPSPSLNWALGNGGFVEGKIGIMYGPESSGKSLLGLLTLIQIQKKYPKGFCLLFDTEFSFNKDWFIKLGGDPKRLILRQTNDPVEIFDYWYGELLELLQEGLPLKGIMLDSIRNIVYPKDMKDVSTKFIQGGTGANYLPSVLKRVVPVVRRYNIPTIFVQQVTEELDMFKKLRNPYNIPDGRALKHTGDYFMLVEKIENKKSILTSGKDMTGSDYQVGHKVRVKIKKNRTGAPYRTAEFTLEYAKGIVNKDEEIYELGKSLNIIRHPINENGKENKMMWETEWTDPIRGENKMKELVSSDDKLKQKILDACSEVNEEINNKRNEEKKSDLEHKLDEEITKQEENKK
jgi:RecA/RadA recombinase